MGEFGEIANPMDASDANKRVYSYVYKSLREILFSSKLRDI